MVGWMVQSPSPSNFENQNEKCAYTHMANRARSDETGSTHRLDRTDMAESPARKSLRSLKLSPANITAIRELLTSLAEADDLIEGFFQDCSELNPYTALMILEGYEQDGFYKLGTASALHRLLAEFANAKVEEKVVKHNFNVRTWDLTPEKIAKIRQNERMERVEMKCLEKRQAKKIEVEEEAVEKPIKRATIIQFPGLPKKS